MTDSKLYLMAELDADSQRAMREYFAAVQAATGAGGAPPEIPYHVTLGTFEMGSEEYAVALMKRVLPGRKQLTLRLDHIGIFGGSVVFIAPNATVELFETVRGFFPDACTGSHMFAPHVTLYSGDAETAFRAVQALAGAFVPGDARLVAVSLYQFPPSRFIHRMELDGM